MTEPSTTKRKRRRVKRISRGYLERVCMYYLERYAASRMRARRFLRKRVDASLAEHNPSDSPDYDPSARESAFALVEEVLDHLESKGLVNDRSYALAIVKRLRKKGKSTRAISSYLRQRGVDGSIVDAVMEEARSLRETLFSDEPCEARSVEEVELESALIFMRKRRLGPWSRREPSREERTRELAKLGRAGFSYRIARQALEHELSP